MARISIIPQKRRQHTVCGPMVLYSMHVYFLSYIWSLQVFFPFLIPSSLSLSLSARFDSPPRYARQMAAPNEIPISSSVALELVIVEAVLFSTAVISYTLRIVLKWRLRDGFGLDDILISLSLLSFAGIEVVRWHRAYTF